MTVVQPPRVLIVSASIGSGHVAAGRALQQVLSARGAEVRHIDLLDYTTAPFRRLYRQAYFDLVRTAPDLVDWLGKRLDAPREEKSRQARLLARLTRLISFHLPRQLAAFRPQLVVHTHFLATGILASRSRHLALPQVSVMTDYLVHGLQMQPDLRRYYVGSDELAAHLRAVGVDMGKVRVSGIPIDPRFARLPQRSEAREALGLSQDSELLLMMTGGMEAKVVLDMLKQLKQFRRQMTVVVITGRSADLRHTLSEAVEDHDGPVRFRILGYSEEVPSYMAAADLLASKPGGLTSAEALAAGLPFAVVSPYPLQEEANANHLLEVGAGMRIDPLTTFSFKVQRFFDEPERRERMRCSALAAGRPQAAEAIGDDLIDSGWLAPVPA